MTYPVRVGIVGVGEISEAIVHALMAVDPDHRLRILLSPRSAVRSANLASRYDQVDVAEDNQSVLNASDVVVLAVLPGQVVNACRELQFDPRHIVVGLAAGWAPSVLKPHVAPAEQVCQLIPLPMIRLRTGPIVLHPDVAAVRDLLAGCGDVVVVEQEADVMALSCASATMSTFFELQSRVIDWIIAKGLDPSLAATYVRVLFAGLSAESLDALPNASKGLVASHETPGGLNERIRLGLKGAGAFDALVSLLDELHVDRRAG